MININILRFNEDFDNIDVSVSTTPGNKIVKVLFWTADTFKNYTEAIDLSYLLSGIDETEDFSVPLSAVNVDEFNDLFFLEFYSDDSESNYYSDCHIINQITGVVGNLTKYHDCLIDKVLSIDIDNCSIANDVKCSEVVDKCDNNIYYLNALLNNVYRALKCGYFDEAVKLLNKIKEMTDDCCNCCDCENEHNCANIYMENNEVKPCV
jgi:hypothetical protein